MSYSKALSNIDPQSFGNWILVDERTITNAVVDYTISNIDGDVDTKWMFEAQHYGLGSATTNISVRPNNNSAVSYNNQRSLGYGTTISADNQATTIGFILSFLNNAINYFGSAKMIIDTKNTGVYRPSFNHLNLYDVTTPNRYVQTIAGTWPNATDKITSFKISSNGATVPKAWIKVYKWTDLKPIELSTQELVKEYNLSNQLLSDTISWDGDVDDHVIIETNLSNSANNVILLRLNGDSTAANYSRAALFQDGAVPVSMGNYTSDGGLLLSAPNSTAKMNSISHIFLKTGNLRSCLSTCNQYDSGNPDCQVIFYNSRWSDTVSKVTSLTLIVGGGTQTGWVRVYKLAKTHLLASDPGLLRGMWQKSIDNDTVQVQSGSIEIAGVNHYVGSPINVTLSGNLRTGESEAVNTYYYLYAIKSSSRIPTFKFSTSQPTLNRFGITVSFDDAEPDQDLYHPTEGITWRYIGQVYNNSLSNILQFDKCKPGYWEGVWITFPGAGNRSFSHGLAKTPGDTSVWCSTASNGTNKQKATPYCSLDNTSGTHGYGLWVNINSQSNIAVKVASDINGWWNNDSGWQTAGYYKLVVKQ